MLRPIWFLKKLYHNIAFQNIIIGLIPKETNSFTAEGLVYKYPLANISAAYLSREHLSDVYGLIISEVSITGFS